MEQSNGLYLTHCQTFDGVGYLNVYFEIVESMQLARHMSPAGCIFTKYQALVNVIEVLLTTNFTQYCVYNISS